MRQAELFRSTHAARVLPVAELPSRFPRTYHNQEPVAKVLEYLETPSQRELLARRIGWISISSAIGTDLLHVSKKLDRATEAFHGIVSVAVNELGYDEEIISMAFRPKALIGVARKAIAYAHRDKPVPIGDLAAGQVVTTKGVSTIEMLHTFKEYFDLPDRYPGGVPSVKQGKNPDNCNSDPGYPGNNLIVPFEHENITHLGELRVLDEEGVRFDKETRDSYVANRNKELELALAALHDSVVYV